MDSDTLRGLNAIRDRLEAKELYRPNGPDQGLFAGADVIITDTVRPHHEEFVANQPLTFDVDDSEYFLRRHLVVTRHAAALSSLFYDFRDNTSDVISSTNKHAFYGSLAQAAINFVEEHGDPAKPFELLKEVYAAGRRFFEH